MGRAERRRFRRPLPQPMLARPDRLPRGDYGYEVKWDGFRALVSTERGLEVRSRRGWEMGERLPELAALPDGLVLDGELVAYGADGRPSFPLLSLRVLLEGVVAKKRTERYLPGERGWVKTKNQDYWRFGSERDLARRRRARLMI